MYFIWVYLRWGLAMWSILSRRATVRANGDTPDLNMYRGSWYFGLQNFGLDSTDNLTFRLVLFALTFRVDLLGIVDGNGIVDSGMFRDFSWKFCVTQVSLVISQIMWSVVTLELLNSDSWQIGNLFSKHRCSYI